MGPNADHASGISYRDLHVTSVMDAAALERQAALDKAATNGRQLIDEPGIHQVEAAPELQDGPDDCGRSQLAPLLLVTRELKRAVGAVLPSPSQS